MQEGQLIHLIISLSHHEGTVDLTITTLVCSIKSMSSLDVVFNYSVSLKMKLSHTLSFSRINLRLIKLFIYTNSSTFPVISV